MLICIMLETNDDKEKLIELYHHYKTDILRVAFDILSDHHEAEDVLHSIVIKLSKHLDVIERVDSRKTKGFVIQVTRNYCYDVFNKQKRTELKPDMTFESIGTFEDEYIFDSYEDDAVFLHIIDRLRRDYAEIIALKYYHEMSIKEISKLLDITEVNARTRLHRAHGAIKQIVDEWRGLEHE